MSHLLSFISLPYNPGNYILMMDLVQDCQEQECPKMHLFHLSSSPIQGGYDILGQYSPHSQVLQTPALLNPNNYMYPITLMSDLNASLAAVC